MINSKIIGGILLVAGTAIGAGMLALPVETASIGFMPTMLAFACVWAIMMISALHVLLATLASPPGMNMIRMSEHHLGRSAKALSLISYLLLLYSLLSAYTSGISAWMIELAHNLYQTDLSFSIAACGASLLLGIILISGIWIIDHINRVLMALLITTFGLLAVCITPHLEPTHFSHYDFSSFGHILPLIVTSFGFHIVIPSLVDYLKRDPKALGQVVVIGSLLPFLVYVLWQALITGAIPTEGPNGLDAIAATGQPAAGLSTALQWVTSSHWTSTLMRVFAASALITSFIGVALSLFDCVKDTLNFDARLSHRLTVSVITLLPPTLFSIFYPEAFINALYFAGIFVAYLLGIMPALLMITLRRQNQLKPSPLSIVAHPLILALNLCFFSFIIMIEVLKIAS